MATWQDFLLSEGYEKLAEAKKYSEVLSQDDPEDDPYRSLYIARENYNAVKSVLKKTLDKQSENEAGDQVHQVDDDFKFVWAALELKLGENYIECEEKSTGEEHLQKCLRNMEGYKLAKEGMGIFQEALNQMGILFTGRRKPDLALNYFKKAEQLYVDFKNLVGGAPCMVQEYLTQKLSDEDCKLEFGRAVKFESAYTHTLFYFAQVYQQLGEAGISAQYCHITLQRQLDAPDLDPLSWSLDAATLSQYYMTERKFNISRHCLASAQFMYSNQADDIDSSTSEEKKEKILQARADLLRCWIKYGLGLLEYSKEKLLLEARSDEGGEEKEVDQLAEGKEGKQSNGASSKENGQSENNIAGENQNNNNARGYDEIMVVQAENLPSKTHERFNLEVSAHEEKIPDKPLVNFEQSREVFLSIKKWIEEAKDFYKLEFHCPDYVAIVQDQSLAFKFLSFFELDMERQCKMHKKRIDMLVEVLKELNPQHYLLVCRQLQFEVADTYSTMMDLKFAILQAAGEDARPTPHHVKKINLLVKESIQYYQQYLDSLKGGKPVYPDEFPSNDIRPGLIAMFCVGRLYSKYLVGEVQARLLNIKKSKDCYQFVVDYCKKNPSAVELVETELGICKEMVELLPAKMERIRLQAEL